MIIKVSSLSHKPFLAGQKQCSVDRQTDCYKITKVSLINGFPIMLLPFLSEKKIVN